MSKKTFQKAFSTPWINPAAWAEQKLLSNVSKSNALRQIAAPGSIAVENIQEGKPITGANVMDPGGWFHDMSGPIADPGTAPTEDATAAGVAARDRVRRQVYRAQGRSSTIKVSPSAAPFTGNQKALLGS